MIAEIIATCNVLDNTNVSGEGKTEEQRGQESSGDASNLGIVPRDKRPALLGASQSRPGLGVDPGGIHYRRPYSGGQQKMSRKLANGLNAGDCLAEASAQAGLAQSNVR